MVHFTPGVRRSLVPRHCESNASLAGLCEAIQTPDAILFRFAVAKATDLIDWIATSRNSLAMTDWGVYCNLQCIKSGRIRKNCLKGKMAYAIIKLAHMLYEEPSSEID